MEKQQVRLDTPFVIGFSILQLAKLWMFQFYYNLVRTNFDRDNFEYVTMDTDSASSLTSVENSLRTITTGSHLLFL